MMKDELRFHSLTHLNKLIADNKWYKPLLPNNEYSSIESIELEIKTIYECLEGAELMTNMIIYAISK